MNFLSQLAKGFVRSTVNQVGRDTGRVISNQIYGNAHSTPIRGIKSENGVFYDETGIVIEDKELCKMLYNQGYKRVFFTSGIFQKMFIWMFGLVISFVICGFWGKFYALVPPIVLILISILKVVDAKKNMYISINKEIPLYKSDLRCKDGKRFVGYKTGEVDYHIHSTKSYFNCHIIIFLSYIFLAAYMYFVLCHFYTMENEFSWIELGQYCLIPLAVLIVLHFVFRK